MINLERLREYPIVCPDTETTGLKWKMDKVFGIALAVWDGKQIESQYWDIREKPHILKVLDGELRHCAKIVNHNMKFDAHMLREAGIRVPLDRIECTSVRAALINEHEPSFSLDSLGRKHVGMGKMVGVYEKLAAMFGGAATREVQMKNLHRAPASLAGEYARPDPEIAIKLWLWQEEEIQRQELQRVWALERELMPVLIDIEKFGVRVDEDRARNEWAMIDKRIEKAQRTLDKIVGRPVNANSPKQMQEMFKVRKTDKGWQTDTGYPLIMTDAGAPSIDKDALMGMVEATGDPRAEAVRVLRQIIKAKSFLKDHILGHAIDGRVYPNYNQTKMETGKGTGPGRLSIDDPALQQIPARDKEVAAIVRSCFLPEKKHVWSCGDWEQFEFRWFAHYTNDQNILDVYRKDPDADYHTLVANITGIPRNPRFAGDANAKQINLGLVFGMGEGTMAAEMGLDYTTRIEYEDDGVTVKREWRNAGPKAKGIFAKYHGAIPGVRALTNSASSIARARGYVLTADGRHVRFPGGKFTHKAAGLVFQGTSAGCMKMKMIALHKLSYRYGFHYLLSVHDENDTSLPAKDAAKLTPIIKAELEKFNGTEYSPACRVPIRCSIKNGPTWWDACKKD